jgi:hypothetical protein
MSTSTDALERHLVADLRTLDALADDSFSRELYCALASRALRRDDDEGHIALSWERAAELVNGARESVNLSAIEGLAGSGGEGEVTNRVRDALAGAGWTSGPENTSRHDDRHVDSPAHPPPASRGGAEPPEWERQAHAEAEINRRR